MFPPHCLVRVIWDVLGGLLSVYYAVMILAMAAFVLDENFAQAYAWIPLDFIMDGFWIMNSICNAYVFPHYVNSVLVTDTASIWQKFTENRLVCALEVIGALPLEIFVSASFPADFQVVSSNIYLYRCIHLVRVVHSASF